MDTRRAVSTTALPTSPAGSTVASSSSRAHHEAAAAGAVSLNAFNMDWSASARDAQHIWMDVDSKDYPCYVCGEVRSSHRGKRQRCMPCKIVVHQGCYSDLTQLGISCRRTFREFRRSNEAEKNEHHWVKQRKATGKCSLCLKAFNIKLLKSKEFVAIGCSWCKNLYHLNCFSSDSQIGASQCHLGELRSYIVPRHWVIRVTRARPADRRYKKRAFIARQGSEELKKPLLAFVNPKSGGNQGAKILSRLLWLLNPRQVFNLLVGGPDFALDLYRKVPRLRILVCGGDGTVGWVLSVIDKLGR